MYDVAISSAVTITRTTAISTYCLASGCECSSTGSTASSASVSIAPPSSVTATSVPGPGASVLSVIAASVWTARRSFLRDQIYRGEDHDPHHVDEVPVETGDLHRLGLLGRQPTLHRPRPQGQQPHDAHHDVRAVEAGEHEERRAEEVRAEVQALPVELGELVHLAADEREPEQRGRQDPHPELAVHPTAD